MLCSLVGSFVGCVGELLRPSNVGRAHFAQNIIFSFFWEKYLSEEVSPKYVKHSCVLSASVMRGGGGLIVWSERFVLAGVLFSFFYILCYSLQSRHYSRSSEEDTMADVFSLRIHFFCSKGTYQPPASDNEEESARSPCISCIYALPRDAENWRCTLRKAVCPSAQLNIQGVSLPRVWGGGRGYGQ